ncbi:hypothetical protein ES703_124519 [subsurface metagenome]
MSEEEGEQQGANVRAINISISHPCHFTAVFPHGLHRDCPYLIFPHARSHLLHYRSISYVNYDSSHLHTGNLVLVLSAHGLEYYPHSINKIHPQFL